MRRRTAVALTLALLLGTGPVSLPSRAAIPGFMGTYDWQSGDPGFGGFSAIEVAADGADFSTLSDRGAMVSGRLLRGPDDRISGVAASPPVRLKRPGTDTPGSEGFDTEGLARAGDGSFFVSGESLTRVLRYTRFDLPPEELPIPDAFRAMKQNGGLEALAIDAAGALYTMPEVTGRGDGATPVYRFRQGRWDQPFLIAGGDGFLPVGADIGPDGRLYLLERQFRGLGGFASRIRRVDLADSGLAKDQTLLRTAPGAFSNLEGIAVWRDSTGALRLTMISDDNFRAVLGTEIVEFRVPD